jgi:hypothetical protein
MATSSAARPEGAVPRLPDFLVIGAPKTGTSSLHRYLGAHPQVFMAEVKELNFFITELNWSRGRDWYEQQFAAAGAAKAVGEASPLYTQHPYYRGVAERAAGLIPHAQLIYVIRNPIEQMLSHYADRRRWASENESVNKALLGNPVYLETARYAFQLEQFLAHFSRDQLHIVISEQLRTAETRARTFAGILRFLGVDERWTSETISEEHNVGVATRRWLFQRLAASRSWGLLTSAAPEWLKRPLSPIVHHRATPREELTVDVERELRSRLADDLAKLRDLVGPEVDAWRLTL